MKKKCSLCNKEIDGTRVPVVALLMAFASFSDNHYSLEATQQTLLSHVNCPTEKA